MGSVPTRNALKVVTFASAPLTELHCLACGQWIDVLWLGAGEMEPEKIRCPMCVWYELPEAGRPAWEIRLMQSRNARRELYLERLNPFATLLVGTRGWEHHNAVHDGPDDPYAVFYAVIGAIPGGALTDLSEFSEFPMIGEPVTRLLPDGHTPFTEIQMVIGWDIVHPKVPEAEICLRWNPDFPQEPPNMLVRNWRKVSDAQLGLLVTEGMKAVRILNRGGKKRLAPDDSMRELQEYADWWKRNRLSPPKSLKAFCEALPGKISEDAIEKRMKAAGVGPWTNYKNRFLKSSKPRIHRHNR